MPIRRKCARSWGLLAREDGLGDEDERPLTLVVVTSLMAHVTGGAGDHSQFSTYNPAVSMFKQAVALRMQRRTPHGGVVTRYRPHPDREERKHTAANGRSSLDLKLDLSSDP